MSERSEGPLGQRKYIVFPLINIEVIKIVNRLA